MPSPEQGSFGIGLLDAPANRGTDPRAQTQIVDHLHPGTVIKRRVLVINDTPMPQRFEVYPAAATVKDGRFTPADDHAENELTSWISLARDRVEVPPKGAQGKVPVELTLRVPRNASTGERYAVVWAQLAAKSDVGTVAINMVNRVGIRVYLHVGPGEEPPSDFAIGKAIPARDRQGTPSVAVEVRNTGGRAVDISGTLRLSDGPRGARGGKFSAGLTTLAAGESGAVTVKLPRDLPNGPWRLDLDFTSGLVKHQATGEVSFPDPGKPGEPSTLTPSRTAWTMIIGPPLGAGVVVFAGLIFVVRRSRRKSELRLD